MAISDEKLLEAGIRSGLIEARQLDALRLAARKNSYLYYGWYKHITVFHCLFCIVQSPSKVGLLILILSVARSRIVILKKFRQA